MFTYIDLFAGVGGFKLALNQLGGKCLGYSEVDKYCLEVLKDNFPDEESLGDVRNLKKPDGEVDIITGGVPCQPWSIAGKRLGFEDERGKLWYDTIRITKELRPKAFIYENVKGITFKNNKESFEYILKSFSNIGYNVKWEVLNTDKFGIPQSRERTYIVGIRKDLDYSDDYKFPNYKIPSEMLYQIFPNVIVPDENTLEFPEFFKFSDLATGNNVIQSWDVFDVKDYLVPLCEHMVKLYRKDRKKSYTHKEVNDSMEDYNVTIKDLEDLVELRVLRKPNDYTYKVKNTSNLPGINGVYKVYFPHASNTSTILTETVRDYLLTKNIKREEGKTFKETFLSEVYHKGNYRPFTNTELKALQGFPDKYRLHPNEKQARKQMGNAVSVPVVKGVASELVKLF